MLVVLLELGGFAPVEIMPFQEDDSNSSGMGKGISPKTASGV